MKSKFKSQKHSTHVVVVTLRNGEAHKINEGARGFVRRFFTKEG